MEIFHFVFRSNKSNLPGPISYLEHYKFMTEFVLISDKVSVLFYP